MATDLNALDFIDLSKSDGGICTQKAGDVKAIRARWIRTRTDCGLVKMNGT
jgi:hypothetical protein